MWHLWNPSISFRRKVKCILKVKVNGLWWTLDSIPKCMQIVANGIHPV